MKKIAVTLCLTAMASAAFAQGTVNFANTTGTLFRTNAIATGGTSGNTASSVAAPAGYYFEVLTAPSTVTSVDASLQALLSAPWSDTGLKGTNGTFATGGRVNGPSGAGGQVNFWPGSPSPGQSFIIVGWSANEGSTWATIASELAGATFNGSSWTGGNLVAGGFLGATTIQAAQSGAPDGTGAFSLFGSSGGSQGTPITTPTTLFVVGAVPEPTSMALAGLGIAVGMILRRRKA